MVTKRRSAQLLTALGGFLSRRDGPWSLTSFNLQLPLGTDTGYLSVQSHPSEEQARTAFAYNGNHFVQPKTRFQKASVAPLGQRVEADPPVISNTTVPDLADENYIWRGHSNNGRSVVKFRVGRIIGQVNAPSGDEAVQIAREAAELLRGA